MRSFVNISNTKAVWELRLSLFRRYFYILYAKRCGSLALASVLKSFARSGTNANSSEWQEFSSQGLLMGQCLSGRIWRISRKSLGGFLHYSTMIFLMRSHMRFKWRLSQMKLPNGFAVHLMWMSSLKNLKLVIEGM